mmetsp:Transcript_6706/g.13615  ORF Transcript_6706/g.13615 Transcript_6706/m.13615 type:complete len:218 (+) Transcript_6706:55-708(+)
MRSVGTDRTLEIEQRLRESVGARVWDAALVLCRYLEECSQPRGIYPDAVRLKGKRVLDLGTGTGLVGIVAHLLGAEQVVLTDREEILPITWDNLKRNLPGALEQSQVEIRPLLWGTGEEAPFGEFDYVFAADLLYNSANHEALVRTLLALCKPRTTVIMVQKWRDAGKESAFLMHAEMAGLQYEQLVLHTSPDGLGMWRWSGFPSDQSGIQLFRFRC